jgi:hypothetical protein
MRGDAVSDFLARAGADWSAIHTLIDRGQIIEMEHKAQEFYMRRMNA